MNEKQQSLGSCTNAGALEDECYADDSEAGENSVNVLPINDAFCTTCYNLKAIMSKELRISTYAKTADAGCNFCFIIYKTALNFQNRWDQTDPYTVWMNLSSEEGENVTSPLMMCMLLQPPISGRRDIGYGRMNNLEIFITPGEIMSVFSCPAPLTKHRRQLSAQQHWAGYSRCERSAIKYSYSNRMASKM